MRGITYREPTVTRRYHQSGATGAASRTRSQRRIEAHKAAWIIIVPCTENASLPEEGFDLEDQLQYSWGKSGPINKNISSTVKREGTDSQLMV